MPGGWHLCTVPCHAAVALLVYFEAGRLLEDRLAARFTALIFGLHPTHPEGVAWVSGVTEPLFALFLFASYLCYLNKRAELERARIYLVGSLFLYALACLSKETAVVLPFIILPAKFSGAKGQSKMGGANCRRDCWILSRSSLHTGGFLSFIWWPECLPCKDSRTRRSATPTSACS